MQASDLIGCYMNQEAWWESSGGGQKETDNPGMCETGTLPTFDMHYLLEISCCSNQLEVWHGTNRDIMGRTGSVFLETFTYTIEALPVSAIVLGSGETLTEWGLVFHKCVPSQALTPKAR